MSAKNQNAPKRAKINSEQLILSKVWNPSGAKKVYYWGTDFHVWTCLLKKIFEFPKFFPGKIFILHGSFDVLKLRSIGLHIIALRRFEIFFKFGEKWWKKCFPVLRAHFRPKSKTVFGDLLTIMRASKIQLKLNL